MPVSSNRYKPPISIRRSVTVRMLLTVVTIVAAVWFVSVAVPRTFGILESTSALARGRSEYSDVAPANPSCQAKNHSEYHAPSVVLWGSDNIKGSAEECCSQCLQTESCNIWVFCSSRDGCGDHAALGECWLKHDADLDPDDPAGARGPDIAWVSGVSLSDEEYQHIRAQKKEEAKNVAKRRGSLRANTSMPLVFLEVSIRGKPLGIMEFVLFAAEAPLAAENFRQLCTGEAGVAQPGHEGAGKAYHFKGNYFYRIINNFIDQSGAGTDSIYGGQFDDDLGGLALKHDRFGLLSMANSGPNTNTAHFSIVVAPAPHLDGKYTIFGELVTGEHVAKAINAVSRGKPQNTAGPEEGVLITASGQLCEHWQHINGMLGSAASMGCDRHSIEMSVKMGTGAYEFK